MHVLNGDPLLVHLMMLHEVKSQQVSEMRMFLFEIQGIVGPYVDLLHDERGRSNSNLRARLFPDIIDARLRLKDLEDYIMFLAL
uniref:Uncharacterized protein n=1 Tax=Lactuca sativa TaxID=4236 RepID=A0A9R1WI53_LACSA|nr:hypothetical protein LSAT_V11C200097000 [Lactuca sativa]